MLKFILRLDDACPTMNKSKWDRVEKLLDKYNIKPIVGIIPDNKDPEFCYGEDSNFWKKANKWQNKGWIIAQHGLNHNLSKEIRTEFAKKGYKEQYKIIKQGLNILKSKNITPVCFFAPAHTFDNNTIKAILQFSDFKFISDGYAFYPYKERGMIFVPSAFDTPHVISKNGVFTFIYHPNNMNENDFNYLEEFIIKNIDQFDINIFDILDKFKNRKRNIFDYILSLLIKIYRKVRSIWKKTV